MMYTRQELRRRFIVRAMMGVVLPSLIAYAGVPMLAFVLYNDRAYPPVIMLEMAERLHSLSRA
jgi:hypothetical protein